MTAAEKQRAYRQRRASKPLVPSPEDMRIAELETRCAALAAENAQLRAENERLYSHNVQMANHQAGFARSFQPLFDFLAEEAGQGI